MLVYFICTTSRTGSSWLCQLLQSAGVFGDPREWLGGHDAYRKDKWEQLLVNNDPLGIKGSIYLTSCIWHYAMKPDLDVRFVMLQREDIRQQAESLAKAEQSQKWIRHQNEENPEPAFDNDARMVDLYAGIIEKCNGEWSTLFRKLGVVPHLMTYEGLVRDPRSEVMRLGDFLSVHVPEKVKLSSDLVKQRGA